MNHWHTHTHTHTPRSSIKDQRGSCWDAQDAVETQTRIPKTPLKWIQCEFILGICILTEPTYVQQFYISWKKSIKRMNAGMFLIRTTSNMLLRQRRQCEFILGMWILTGINTYFMELFTSIDHRICIKQNFFKRKFRNSSLITAVQH